MANKEMATGKLLSERRDFLKNFEEGNHNSYSVTAKVIKSTESNAKTIPTANKRTKRENGGRKVKS